MKVQENLLHYIWPLLKNNSQLLKTSNGLVLEVLDTGKLNKHAGPDFKEAMLKIAGQLWAGSVEIHVLSSDWNKHNHSKDENYNNVILHVVYSHDEEIKLPDGTLLPVLELKEFISDLQLRTFQSLLNNSLAIPCQKLVRKIEPIYLSTMLRQAAVERLSLKSKQVLEEVEQLKGDWNTAFYFRLCENFGFKSNSAAMRSLAEKLPLSVLAKHKDNLHDLLALLFGQAGFLNGMMKDEYSKELKESYSFLSKKYKLNSAGMLNWNFVKTRPANFPGIRLSQFAFLIHSSSHLFSKVLEISKLLDIIALFEVEADEYWRFHYHLAQKRKRTITAKLGTSSIHNILINTVASFLFAYADMGSKEVMKEKAIHLLQMLPAEQNRVVKLYRTMGFTLNNALESQGCLGLHKNYCGIKKCLSCAIGIQIVS